MPYCPSCRAEYRAGREVCAECGVPLVDWLPPAPEQVWDPTDWMTVEEVGDEATASIIEGFLLEQGFPVRVLNRKDRAIVTTLGELGRVEIQVPIADFDAALAVMEERDRSIAESEPDEATAGDEGDSA